MRIALVGDYPLDPNTISGGPQAVFAYLLMGLRQFDSLDLHVVSTKKEFAKISKTHKDGITFHFLPHPKLPFELAFPIVRSRVQKVLRQVEPDLIHAQSAHLYGAACTGAACPVVATAHNVPGTDIAFIRDWVARLRLAIHERWTSKIFYANIRYIISISEHISRGLAAHTNATFYAIDNPVANIFFELSANNEIPGRVLFAGFLMNRKRPDLALEALLLARKKADNLCIHFAGSAVDQTIKTRLHNFVVQNNLEQYVSFLGHLKETQLLEAYEQMSMLLLTSNLETSPMVIEQAMAAGKPVVATAVGGVPYLIDHDRTGILVEPNQPAQIAQALVRLNQDAALRQKIGCAARKEAGQRFKADVVANKVYDVYREILSHS